MAAEHRLNGALDNLGQPGNTSLDGPLLGLRPGCLAAADLRLQARPTGLPFRFCSDWDEQRRYLPLGIDVFFTCVDTMVALPRGLQLT